MPSEKRQRQRAGREARRAEARAAQIRAARRRQIISVLVLALVVGGIGLGINLTSDAGDELDASSESTTTTAKRDMDPAIGTTECPPPDGATEKTTTFESGPEACIDVDNRYTAEVETDVGTFTIELHPKQAPKSVNNFVFLARHNAYDDVPFHRVIPDFVVQGGDVAMQGGMGGPGYQFANEVPDPEDYEAGSVAMANSGPDTNGSQFFVVTSEAGAKALVEAVGGTANYSLFGKVVSGMEVVKQIEADGSQSGTPTVEHRIINVTIREEEG